MCCGCVLREIERECVRDRERERVKERGRGREEEEERKAKPISLIR